MKLILAMDTQGGIAKDGKIPWKVPEDMKMFKRLTMGCTVIMGRKTYDSIGHGLEGRYNIVITSTPRRHETTPGGFPVYFVGVDEAIVRSLLFGKEIWVIGGTVIADMLFQYITEMYISAIPGKFDCDLFAPKFVLDTFDDSKESKFIPEIQYTTHGKFTLYRCFSVY